MSALEIQWEYLKPAKHFMEKNGVAPVSLRILEIWDPALTAIEEGNLDKTAREIDWVTKHRYRTEHDLPFTAPRIAQLELAYRPIINTRDESHARSEGDPHLRQQVIRLRGYR